MRVENPNERNFYEIESAENNWSLKELKRQMDSALYERLSLSRDKEGVKQLSQTGQIIEIKSQIILNVNSANSFTLNVSALRSKNLSSKSSFAIKLFTQLRSVLRR